MKRILILSASAGAGHVRAAQALEKALIATGQVEEVVHEDALKYTNVAFRRVYSKSYLDMVNSAPQVLGLLYDFADKPWKDERQRLAFDRLNTMPLVRMLNKYKPDLVLNTHFLPAEIISFLNCRGKIHTRNAVVVTDLDVHSMWLCHHYWRYFVALEETRMHLTQLGFSPERVMVSGIPVDPIFAAGKDKLAMRKKYNLDPLLPTIYMSTGGFGVGPTEELLESLMKMKQPAQVLAMCGRNDALKERLLDEADELSRNSNLKVVPIGFTTDVDEYMAASDMVLGKPGGLTTSEALCKGLIFVVVNPIPGQEERNADHLLEEGAAIRCNNLPTLAYKVDTLIENKERFLEMRENALRLAKPKAAERIVEAVLNHINEPSLISKPTHRCATIRERAIKSAKSTAGTIVSRFRRQKVY